MSDVTATGWTMPPPPDDPPVRMRRELLRQLEPDKRRTLLRYIANHLETIVLTADEFDSLLMDAIDADLDDEPDIKMPAVPDERDEYEIRMDDALRKDAPTTRGSRSPREVEGMPPVAAYNLGYQTARDDMPMARGGFITGKGARLVGEPFGIDYVIPASTLIDRNNEHFLEQLAAAANQPIRENGTLQIPAIMWTDDERDTPKMIYETLTVAQTWLGVRMAALDKLTVNEPFIDELKRHSERLQRLINSAEKGLTHE